MERIYIVYENYNNGGAYDAEYKYSTISKIFSTEEKAKEYIASLEVPYGNLEGFVENENVWDERKGIRWFHEIVGENDPIGLSWYSIESYKVDE